MDTFVMPAGAKIGGVELTEPMVCPPCHVTIGDAQHGPEIFSKWTAQELEAVGIVAATPALPDPRDAILQSIYELEALQTPRLLREALRKKQTVIDDATSPLNGMTPEAAIGYIDTEIEALRAQLV